MSTRAPTCILCELAQAHLPRNEESFEYIPSQQNHTDLAGCWREYRSSIFPDVNETRRNGLYRTVVKAQRIEERIEDKNMDIVEAEACKELALLEAEIDRHVQDRKGIFADNVKIMLHFDEAHVLTDQDAPSGAVPLVTEDFVLQKKTLYDVFCSILLYFLPNPVFVIFLFTEFYVEHLAPNKPMARSSRFQKNFASVQAPITEAPFYCSDRFPLDVCKVTMEDLSTVEFMTQFG
ncbi:uncharacterized protein FIBRA_07910 [Fibroporia radiculosa]|uniref:Uncharacterized protein n=1 Tax=Fibroporia radiculosa TaxID=599839 RepID=J4H4W1_9APHY|nr:uncharacterized protein FIBRA_07910 [Fibroporia radiculosa]CCM05679.1 predicted protein [Fibroporia radiculosa]